MWIERPMHGSEGAGRGQPCPATRLRPRSLKGLPARRNPVLEPAPKIARYGRYVNIGPQRTPGGRRSERVTGKL